jgi:hypothetical protein
MKKPVWVFVCGVYRSASTTQYLMTRDIVESTGNGVGIGYHQEQRLKKHDTPSPHRYIVCKVFEFLPEGFRHRTSVGQTIYRERRLKALATIRDPRDIITSMRERHRRQMEDPKHQRRPFDFEHRVEVEFPVWLKQLTKWIDMGPSVTMFSRYEVFTANLTHEVQRIADHLRINMDRGAARKIAGKYTLKAIMDHKKKHRREGKREDPHLPSIPGPLFGKTGAHQEHLSQEEKALVEKVCRGFMRRFGYL